MYSSLKVGTKHFLLNPPNIIFKGTIYSLKPEDKWFYPAFSGTDDLNKSSDLYWAPKRKNNMPPGTWDVSYKVLPGDQRYPSTRSNTVYGIPSVYIPPCTVTGLRTPWRRQTSARSNKPSVTVCLDIVTTQVPESNHWFNQQVEFSKYHCVYFINSQQTTNPQQFTSSFYLIWLAALPVVKHQFGIHGPRHRTDSSSQVSHLSKCSIGWHKNQSSEDSNSRDLSCEFSRRIKRTVSLHR